MCTFTSKKRMCDILLPSVSSTNCGGKCLRGTHIMLDGVDGAGQPNFVHEIRACARGGVIGSEIIDASQVASQRECPVWDSKFTNLPIAPRGHVVQP